MILREKFLPGKGWWSLPFLINAFCLPTHSNSFFNYLNYLQTKNLFCFLENFFIRWKWIRWKLSLELSLNLQKKIFDLLAIRLLRLDFWKIVFIMLNHEVYLQGAYKWVNTVFQKKTFSIFLTKENLCYKTFHMFFIARLHKFFVRFREFFARLFPRPGPEQSSNVQLRTFSRSSQIFSIVEIEPIPPLNSQFANFSLGISERRLFEQLKAFLVPFLKNLLS